MTETSKLGLPLLAAAQAQKHVTVNEAFALLDALTELRLDGTATVPPASAAEGDVYSVAAGATGAWAGQDANLAVYLNGGWCFVVPKTGWRAWLADAGGTAVFDGVGWVAGAGAVSASGAGFVHRSIETDHTVAAGGTSVVAGAIPQNATVYGITGRVLSPIGGAATLQIGVTGSSDRYGSGIGTSTGAWARGLTESPLTYYADTDLVLTAEGGVFDGSGSIRLAVHYAELTLPRA